MLTNNLQRTNNNNENKSTLHVIDKYYMHLIRILYMIILFRQTITSFMVGRVSESVFVHF